MQNRVSGHEKNTAKAERVVRHENGACTKKEDEAANLLPGVEERRGKIVLSTYSIQTRSKSGWPLLYRELQTGPLC